MILKEETYKKFGYYPSDLTPMSAKHIITKCDGCGKTREPKKSEYRALCMSCAQRRRELKYPKLSDKGWLHGVYWGKNLSTYQIAQIVGCSQANVFLALKKLNIKTRSTSEAEAGDLNWNFGRYHSKGTKKKMKGVWHLTHHVKRFPKHHTKPERIFEEISKKNNLPFKYTGDGSFWIENLNPDFIDVNGKKLAVEIFGDYWHSPLLNKNIRYSQTFKGRKKILKEYGWELIVFWGSDMLRKDAEQFVLNQLTSIK